ncbi:P-loop containing nucleoside triphosphate hydrolase [Syntrophomonas zehnderi OL-4]|uniref:p-loop containing nucleoside triphosphate hydrolase n=1 Tax=Syntrophomonas zehnderi OL-4 TaxID=690567 RepID=A0A0E4G8N4_9FIRM|nr:hypothetical protein [Syntrophomonas zehnderi]CFW96170.1 P-loop containing nucleoside triphosphate hydrolase [Syntrophomonas zehnderi OL-4]
MNTVAVISKHPGSGQTTVLVNLASGLVRSGYRVIIGELGKSGKIHNWLGVNHKPKQVVDMVLPTTASIKPNISSSPLGIDLVTLVEEPQTTPLDLTCLEMLGYDYLLLHPSGNEYCKQLAMLTTATIVCTDLTHDNELKEFQALEECLQSLGKGNGIDLILPNKINTQEWEQNTQQLFALVDYFGYEKIADPIPL